MIPLTGEMIHHSTSALTATSVFEGRYGLPPNIVLGYVDTIQCLLSTVLKRSPMISVTARSPVTFIPPLGGEICASYPVERMHYEDNTLFASVAMNLETGRDHREEEH